MTKEPVETTLFVLLRGLAPCDCGTPNCPKRQEFFTMYRAGEDLTSGEDGIPSYEVFGYASSVEEAQIALFGRSFSTSK